MQAAFAGSAPRAAAASASAGRPAEAARRGSRQGVAASCAWANGHAARGTPPLAPAVRARGQGGFLRESSPPRRAALAPLPSSPLSSVATRAAAAGGAEADPADTNSGKRNGAQLYAAIGLWYVYNIVFAIANKQTLNALPYPWFLSWMQIAIGSAMMGLAWATKVVKYQEVSLAQIAALVPVSVFHLIGHVSACVSFSKSAVSFTSVVKAAEPGFSVVIQQLFFGEAFSGLVWLSLLPIIGGVAIASMTEINFNVAGFQGAMISNIGFVFRNIYSKKKMDAIQLGGINLYAWISILSTVLLLPLALLMEGWKVLFGGGWAASQAAYAAAGNSPAMLLPLLLFSGVMYHMYNQSSYEALEGVSPLGFSVANTMKRVAVIVASILIFRNPITPINALASAIAVLGTFLYSLARDKEARDKAAAGAAKKA